MNSRMMGWHLKELTDIANKAVEQKDPVGYWEKYSKRAEEYFKTTGKKENMENGQIVDAEWVEESTTLPAIKYEPVRHPKLAGVEKGYLEEIKENLRLDEELELPKQAIMDSRESLEKDIDELTKCNDYHEITRRQVEELFEIPKMKLMCFGYNIKEIFKGIFNNTHFQMFLFFFVVVSLIATSLIISVDFSKTSDAFAFIGFLLCVVVAGILLFKLFTPPIRNPYKFSFLSVDLKVEPLNETLIKIPKGAKLRTLEAKKAGLFTSFIIARPDCTVHEREFRPTFNLDPAILGVAPDKRMFMVVYWDIKHDIEKTVEKIDRFKKFKLKET